MIEIENAIIPKPYLGGWRHKITGIDYLNAASQTGPPPSKLRKNTCSRMVQTIKTTDVATQPLYHRATQMWRNDCYIPNEADKYMTVKYYESYIELQQRINLDEYACIIQRYYRAYRLMKYVRKCAKTYRDLFENCRRHEEEKVIVYKMQHKQNILRQTYPRSRADFDMLYNLIEKWRIDRLKDMKSRLFRAGQCAENYTIIEKMVEMNNQIDLHKQAIKSAYRKQRVLRFLAVNCKPIRWHSYKGIPVEMVTMKIQKAREFKKVYDALNTRDVSSEERMKLLITLKKSLEMHNCIEAFDLLSLLNQEIALLSRNIKGLQLCGFNERIMHAYLNFVNMYGNCGCECIDPHLNEMREPLETKTKICRSCLRLLPQRRFLSHTRMKELTVCISCNSLSERNIMHVNYDPYMFILNCVRADEQRRKSGSAFAFIMQKHDIYHLINHIWHGRSAVSKNMDLSLLRMARYRKDIEWSPWNCILLTKDEADIHYRIDDLAMIYAECLLSQIDLAHQIAKNHFKQLITFEKNFRESSFWAKIQNGIQYKPPLTLETYDPSKKYDL